MLLLPPPPTDIQTWVTLAFCLEPLAEKSGCTTRSIDLPGKPLTDFLIAGINAAPYFFLQAEKYYTDQNTPLFSFFIPALQASNNYKSAKTINFGLLEIMFQVVAARLHTDDPKNITDKIIELLKTAHNDDVITLCEARKIAWKSSVSQAKQTFDTNTFSKASSPYLFYEQLHAAYPPTDSNWQWVEEYKQGLPTLNTFLHAFLEHHDPVKTSATVYEKIRLEKPDLKVGIIADMAAAALFLYFSFVGKK